jgi:secreted trypsin-like serine protease
LGAHNISNDNEHGSVRKDVKKIKVHETWDPTDISHDHDIALIKLESSIEFSQFIQPICLLPPNNSETFSHGNVTAWGKIDDSETLADVARTAELEIIDMLQCLRDHEELARIFWPESFCARSDNAGVCEGDSGSGLVVKIDDRYYLKGLVSSSLVKQCSEKYVAIYSDTQKYYDFIKVRNEDYFNRF